MGFGSTDNRRLGQMSPFAGNAWTPNAITRASRPVAPAGSVGLYLPCDGAEGQTTIVDASANAVVGTMYGANTKLTAARALVGPTALSLDGSASGSGLMFPYVAAKFPLMSFQSPNWTISFWVWFNTVAGTNFLVNMGGGNLIAFARPEIYLGSGQLTFAASSTNTSYDIGAEGAGGQFGAPTANKWTYIEVCRSNASNYFLFMDGILGRTIATTAAIQKLTGQGLVLGASIQNSWVNTNLVAALNGYIDEFMILDGICRHTASFTPPPAPLPWNLVTLP